MLYLKIVDSASAPRIISLTKAPWMLNPEELETEEDDDLEVLEERVRKAPLHYVSVIKSSPEEDSFVECSVVPALKSLARGALPDGGLNQLPVPVKVTKHLNIFQHLELP